jgi:hypothetical protein
LKKIYFFWKKCLSENPKHLHHYWLEKGRPRPSSGRTSFRTSFRTSGWTRHCKTIANLTI